MPHLELFHIPGACSRVTLAALEMSGAPYTATIVQVHKGELESPVFKARNPLGQVPTLLIDGQPLTENVAILLTLSRLFPLASILPDSDVVTGAITLSRIATCGSQLHPIMTRMMFPERFCNLSPEASARVREQAGEMMLARLTAIAPALRSKSWWVADTFSIADVYLSWITNRMRHFGLDFSSMSPLNEHLDRVRNTALIQRVLQLEKQYLSALQSDGATFPAHILPTMAD